jgi:ABC-type bacteriocin/lantibiotic exporter with double-glycine peptidase domain
MTAIETGSVMHAWPAVATIRRTAARLAPECTVLLGLVLATCCWIAGRPPSAPAVTAQQVYDLWHRPTVDCGAASLYVACRALDVPASLDDLRTSTRTSAAGTSLYDLNVAAAELRLSPRACRGDFTALAAHLSSRDRAAVLFLRPGHFVAAMGCDDGRVCVADPALGVAWLPEKELIEALEWRGEMLLLERP